MAHFSVRQRSPLRNSFIPSRRHCLHFGLRSRATRHASASSGGRRCGPAGRHPLHPPLRGPRSEEHTSELQSLTNLVCRLLLEKKKKQKYATSLLQKKK